MESTGHYHKILFHSLCKSGFEVSVINPIQTDSIKNIGIRKVKNDKVDARKITLLYRFQELEVTNIPDEDIECLRNLCRQYYKLNDELTVYKNRLIGIVDQLMLNFKDVFSSIFSKAAIAVLEEYPTPDHILRANIPMLALTLELPQSIPGVDLLTAATILAEVGDFSAFTKPGKLVAYFGTDPSVMPFFTVKCQLHGRSNIYT